MRDVPMDPRQARVVGVLAALCAAIPAGMSLQVLAGWQIGNDALIRVVPGCLRVLPNSALMIGLASFSLVLLLAYDRGPGRALSGVLASAGVAIGLATLAEYAGITLPGLDTLLFPDKIAELGMATPGRPSPHTALALALASLSLALRAVPRSGQGPEASVQCRPAAFARLKWAVRQLCGSERLECVADVAAGLALLIGYLGLQGNLFEVRPLHSVRQAAMSVPIALAVCMVATGSILSCKERGLAILLASSRPSGTVLRRFLPFVFIVPLVVGWFSRLGERQGLYGAGVDMVLMSTLMTIAAAPLVVWLAVTLDQSAIRQEAVVRDLSERARIESELAERDLETARLRELAALKDHVLSTLSHEVKTPLSLILGYAELLEEDHPEDFRVEGILDGCKRLSAHINALLDYSALAAGGLPLYKTEVILPEIVRSAIAGWSPTIRSSGVRFETSLSPDVPPVEGDARRIAEILDILLDNALKFTPRGQIVRVETFGCGERSCLRVIDTGPGIDPAALGRIWEPFGKAEIGAQWRGGLGLGLALARKLVEVHGGTLEVDSEIGRGCTFTVQLPVMKRNG